jgi:hypothetical protein
MNVLLLVIDSLRACTLASRAVPRPRTPFLDRLGSESIHFRRAYATECWTLPTHMSMFTGLLPSEHQAHFQTMRYTGSAPTIAELAAAAGSHTEIVTRNFIFDGTIPGVTRGFQHNTRLLADTGRITPFALFLALAKPRFRRHLRDTGFFHPLQRNNRRFLTTFARSLLPADDRVLGYVCERMRQLRRMERRFFLFCNLYDVHAPYPPTPHSLLRPLRSPSGWIENLIFPTVMAKLGAHRYLRPGFSLSARGRQMLRDRYHRAIELMDAKLAAFYGAARSANLFDETLVILTSDHGEAFGEHGLYLHDASTYDTHLHVPLWVHHPARGPEVIDDVVSTRHLFGVMRTALHNGSDTDTILDARFRARHAIALAEHFHYPHLPAAHPRYRQDLAATVHGDTKIILRDGRVDRYDLARDPDEQTPQPSSPHDFVRACRQATRDGAMLADAVEYLRARLAMSKELQSGKYSYPV